MGGTHHHSDHIFEYRSVDRRKLVLSLSITLIVMVIELIGGYLTNSISLISDAGHMFTHAFAISIGLAAILIAARPPCHHRTFGLFRSEVLAAFINGLFLLLVVGIILYESALRILEPEDVDSLSMLGIACIGLATNVVSIMILHGSEKHDMNIRGVFYHMLGDALSSVGIVIAAAVIYYTGWNLIDPLVSIGISILIAYWAVGILRESTSILLEMAPEGMDVETISKDLQEVFPQVSRIYDIHLWAITQERISFSAHMKLKDPLVNVDEQGKILQVIEDHLKDHYSIEESTIQIDSDDKCEDCSFSCSK